MNGIDIKQGPSFRVDTSQPLDDVLGTLLTMKPELPGKRELVAFLGGPEHIPEAQTRGWYRRAWWGYYAARVLYQYSIAGRSDEISRLVLPVDTAPLEEALAANKGVILACNHLGPYPALYGALRRASPEKILTLTSNKERSGEDMVHVTSPEEQKLSLVRSMLCLRKNGIVRLAPDGRVVGESTLFFRFMGQRVRMANGVGALAGVSGAKTLYCTATWVASNQIQIRIEPLRLGDRNDSDKDGAVQWYTAYLRRLEAQIRARPQDIGFRSGHILAHRGRLKHYPAPR